MIKLMWFGQDLKGTHMS